MRGAYPHPMLVTLVYVLLTSVLASAIMYFVNNPFQIAYMYLLDGIYDPETIFHYVFLPGRVALYAVLELLISLYTCVMGFGYTSSVSYTHLDVYKRQGRGGRPEGAGRQGGAAGREPAH